MSNYCKEHGSKTDFCVSDCDEVNGIHLKELNQSPILMIEGLSRDTVFYDSNGDEYLRIGADNVPADVYERFTSWCMHLPPVHDAEVRRLTDERDAMREQLKEAYCFNQGDADRYRYVRKNMEWRRSGTLLDDDSHSFVGCRFPLIANFESKAMLDDNIDRMIKLESMPPITQDKGSDV